MRTGKLNKPLGPSLAKWFSEPHGGDIVELMSLRNYYVYNNS